VGEDWCKDVEIPTKLKIKGEEKKKGSGKGKRSNQTQNHENAEAKEPEVTKNSGQHDAPELNDSTINKNEMAAESEATHTVILEYFTIKEYALFNFAFQSF
jgi:hypothetical protein